MKISRKRSFTRWGRSIVRWFKKKLNPVVGWWKKNNRRFGLPWRIASIALASLMLFVTVLPILEQIDLFGAYRLDSDTRKLVGSTDTTLAQKLSYDTGTNAYAFNKTAVKDTSDTNPFANMQAQLSSTDSESESLYALDVYRDGKKGVTYHDVNTGLQFDLLPDFVSSVGREVDGHLVFPTDDGHQMVYTVKNNGLKEDIIVKKVSQDTLSFSYTVNLPETLSIRELDDGSGAIGVYSADPSLFGDITYNSETDRETVAKAQKSADKTYLVFGIPAPVIKDTAGNDVGSAKFTLEGNTLTVIASGLSGSTTPISIDPSVVVTSASDFLLDGNDEGNISFGTADQITRAGIAGGSFRGGWSTTTALPVANTAMGYAVYNNRIYTVSGSGYGKAVYYAQINENGTLGSWTQATDVTTARTYAGAAVYNGYLYLWGGYDTATSTATASVEYTKINPDGTLNAWQTTSSMTTAVCRAGTASYGGYLYAFGGSTSPNSGCTSSSAGAISTVQYAPIRADGSVGSWQSTTSLGYGTSGAVIGAMAGGYNKFMYVLGGHNNGGGTAYTDFQYAPIHDDGTLGSWTALSSLPTAIHSAGFTIKNGYLYVLSDQSNSYSLRYTQIYASGRTNTWSTYTDSFSGRWGGALVVTENNAYYLGGTGPTNQVNYTSTSLAGRLNNTTTVNTPFSTSRERGAAAIYGSCIYMLGGYGSNSNTYVNYAQYSSINSDGNITTSWANKSFSTARADLAAVAYDGYLYVMGGYNANTGTYFNDVQYAAINSDCSLGNWSSTTAFDTSSNARGGISAAIYNGYIYITGGKNASDNFSTVRYAPINSDGTVGSWNTTTNMPTAMNRHRTVVAGNRMYILGGTQLSLPDVNNGASSGTRYTGAGYNTTYFATINASGGLGSWQSTTALPYDVYEFGATATDGYVYIGGGFTSSGLSTRYYYAKINTNGSLGEWQLTYDGGETFASNILLANGNYIYELRGRVDSTTTATGRRSIVNYGTINNGGSGNSGDWTASANLSNGRDRSGSVAYNGYAYVVGGSTDGGSTGRSDIEYSALNAGDGTLSGFTTDSHTLSNGRMFPGVAAYDGYLYVVGGKSSSTYYGDVQYAPIGTNGALGSDFATTSSFVTGTGSDTGRAGTCVVAQNGYLYAIGGWDGTTYRSDVRYAAINNDGSLGSWTDSGQTFTNGRYGSSCFAANGRLYMLGGASGSNVYSDVQVATIASNGSLGSWTALNSFRGGRSHFITGYSNGFVYIYGGCTTSGCSAGHSNIQYASINTDGTLNQWQWKNTTNTGYTPYLSTGFAYGGYLYQLGGAGITSGAATTSRAPLAIAARIGRYSKIIDLGATSLVTNITYSDNLQNGYAPGASSVAFKSANSNGVFTTDSFASDTVSAAGTCGTTNAAYTRYILVSVTLDDTTSSAFADDNAIRSSLSDITIDYTPAHAPPEIRLRSGQTLQNGNLSALDTCYP